MLSTAGGGDAVPRCERQRERTRFEVLEWIYDRCGRSCRMPVTGTQIGTALGMAHEDLYRIIHFLEERGYLHYEGAGPTVSLTEKGIRYMEVGARKRRTIRA